jgi:hypothetical protein
MPIETLLDAWSVILAAAPAATKRIILRRSVSCCTSTPRMSPVVLVLIVRGE